MKRYSPLLLILLLMSFGKCNPKVQAPSSNTQSLNPTYPDGSYTPDNFRDQVATGNEEGFEVFDDDQDDDAYLNYNGNNAPTANIPTLVPGQFQKPPRSGKNPWMKNPISFPVNDTAAESTPVLCKHAAACADGYHRDALMGKNACETIHAIRELAQCKKTRQDGFLISGYDVNCSCADVCNPKELRKKPNTLADQQVEQLSLGQVFDEDELKMYNSEESYIKQMAALDMTEKFNNFASFNKDEALPADMDESTKQKFFKEKIRHVVSGKATSFPGYKNLNDVIKKEPIFKSMLKEEMLKSMEPTSPLTGRWEIAQKKLELNDDPMNFNLKTIAANLKKNEPLARRKALIKIQDDQGDEKLIGGMPINVPGIEMNGKDNEGEFEKTCLYRPDSKPGPCQSYLKKYSNKTILMPENKKVENILLEPVPDDLKEAVAKADMEQCWAETNCKAMEKKFGDNQELEQELSQSLPRMKLTDSPKINPNNEKMAFWDECDESGGFTANYHGTTQNSRCAPARHISKDFGNFLNDNFALCVNTALASIGREKSAKVHMVHRGIQGNAGHSSRSLHSVARAIDVKAIKVTYPDGRQESFEHFDAYNKKGDNNPFYGQFRNCWSKKVTEKNASCNKRTLKNRGSIGHEHRDHKHHLHLSFPYCPRQGFYAK